MDLIGTSSMDEAYKKIEKIVGYKINSNYYIFPPLRSKEDAEKLIGRYLRRKYEEYELLFD